MKLMFPGTSDRSPRHAVSILLRALVVGILSGQIAAAQSFAVRNPNHLSWPQAEAEKLYKYAGQVVSDEFKPRTPVHPQFTLVLGNEKDQLDVNSNELRLRKWDKRLFTEGVVLFGFEQMSPTAAKENLVKRVLKESDSVLSVDEATSSRCPPNVDCTPAVKANH